MKKLGLIAMLGMLVGVSACKGISEIDAPLENFLKEEVVIKATHELDPQTRTILQENGDVWWKPGDAIDVFFGPYVSRFHAYNMEDAPVGNFIGNALIIQGNTENSNGKPAPYSYWGVFPSDLWQEGSFDYMSDLDYKAPTREKESVNVYLPAKQKGVAGTFDSNSFISIAQSSDYKELSFYNLCGGLAFCVEKEGIHTVTFSGNAGETLAGQVNVVMNSEGRPVVNKVLNGKTEVTLAMKKGEYFIPGEWYYIVMLPIVLEKGYTIKFQSSSYRTGIVKTSTPVEIKRSVFGRLTNPDADIETSPVAKIVIDGDFSDWDALDPSLVSVATCDPDARWTALKTLKAFTDDDYIGVYVEIDLEQIADRDWVPFHIWLNADGSDATGGGFDQWTENNLELMLEGAIFESGVYCSYDPAFFFWNGPVGEQGWYWDILLDAGSGIATGCGSGNKYEILVDKFILESCWLNFAETFCLGVDIQQSWESVGVLPNTAVTEVNASGIAPLLKLSTIPGGGDVVGGDEEEDNTLPNSIVIDGDFSDWDALDPALMSIATCALDARWTALKTLKAYANDDYVNVYIEIDMEQIADRDWVPFDICLNADGSDATGGGYGQWTENNLEVLLQGAIIAEGAYCSYDGDLYPWLGETGADGWFWGESMYTGFTSGAGNGAEYEIMITKEFCPDIEFADNFGLGVDILQLWCSVGVLPNADMTEENPSGLAPLLKVRTIHHEQ